MTGPLTVPSIILLAVVATAAFCCAVVPLHESAGGGSWLVRAMTLLTVAAAAFVGFAGGLLLERGRPTRLKPVDRSEAPTVELRLPPLTDSPELLSYIIDSMEGGVMTVSSAGTITSFNSVAQKTLGYEAPEVVGEHFAVVFADIPANHIIHDMIRSALARGQTFSSVEVNAARADGKVVPLGVTVSPLRGEGGRPRGIVLTFKDMAQLKQLREHVQRTDQLASLGRLAAGMAHEIRNPLGALHGLVELIQEDLSGDDPRREYTGRILRTVDQLNTLVENLLTFSQPPVTHLEAADLRELVGEAVQLCAFEFRSRDLTLEENYGPGPVQVTADRETLTRAFVNIVRNAFEAALPAGTVSVSIARQTASPPASGPDEAVVSIFNAGSYISPEDRNKVFTPFFTTKPQGTGLGLPIAHQIVTAHSGRIEIRSDLDAGTTFLLSMPLRAAAPAAAVPEQVREAAHER